MKTISATEARRNLKKILDHLTEPVMILRRNKPVKVIVKYEEFAQMVNASEGLRKRWGIQVTS